MEDKKVVRGGRQFEARNRHLAHLLTPAEVAAMLGVQVQTLTAWRCRGSQELEYIRVGRCIRYRAEAVEDYLRRQTVGAVREG
jgi:excisionase family DNA binding protein